MEKGSNSFFFHPLQHGHIASEIIIPHEQQHAYLLLRKGREPIVEKSIQKRLLPFNGLRKLSMGMGAQITADNDNLNVLPKDNIPKFVIKHPAAMQIRAIDAVHRKMDRPELSSSPQAYEIKRMQNPAWSHPVLIPPEGKCLNPESHPVWKISQGRILPG